MYKTQGPPRCCQNSGAEQASPAPEDGSGCPKRRPASANQPLGPRCPAISGLFSDAGGLPVPGGQWGWAGPRLHTQALWGGHAAQAEPRAWNAWQPSERDGTLLLS